MALDFGKCLKQRKTEKTNEEVEAYGGEDEEKRAQAESAGNGWSEEASPLIAWLAGPTFGQCCQPMARQDEEGRPTHMERLFEQFLQKLSQSPFADSWTVATELLERDEKGSDADLRSAAGQFLAEGPCPSGDRKWDLELFFAEAAYWPVAHAQNIMLHDLKRMAEDRSYSGALVFLDMLGSEIVRKESREAVALEVAAEAMETLASEVDTLCLWRDDTLDYPSRISFPNICMDADLHDDEDLPLECSYITSGPALCDAAGISPTFVLACVAKDLQKLCNLPMHDLLEFVATGCARREVSRFFMASDSPTPSHPARLPDEGDDCWLLPSLNADAKDRAIDRCDALAVRLHAVTANALQADEEDGTRLSGACLNKWEGSLGYALVQH